MRKKDKRLVTRGLSNVLLVKGADTKKTQDCDLEEDSQLLLLLLKQAYLAGSPKSNLFLLNFQ